MFEFKFADIGEGIHEGKLLEFLVNEGDLVENGQSLFLVETDKVNAEIPSPKKGIVKKLCFNIGDIIKVGDTVVILEDEGSNDSQTNNNVEEKKEEESAGVVGEIKVSNDLIPSFVNEDKADNNRKKKVLATPVARKLAKDLGVDIKEVVGSGFNGRVMKEDIKKFSLDKKTVETREESSNKNFGDEEFEYMSSTRKAISQAMELSKKNIPHTILYKDIEVDKLYKLRNELNEEGDIHLTYMPFIIKALCLCIKYFPIFNSEIDGDKIIFHKSVNIGIGVDTEFGLMLPVIKDAHTKSMLSINEELKTLAQKSRSKKLTLEDISNGTISITNFGKYAKYASPIIKWPQVAILGIGAIEEGVCVKNHKITTNHLMHISMAVDHRIIDGGDVGRFIEKFESLIKNPKLLLLS